MRLYLATWEPDHGDSKNVTTRYESGGDQWQMLEEQNKQVRLKILLSYWYYKDADLDALFSKYFTQPYPEVFADSGAYSAATQGVNIDIRDYAAWIKKYQHLFSVYSNLDVIGDPVKTLENQKTLESFGLSPLPVFHAGFDFKPLENLLSLGYKYVALGGLVPYASRPKVRMKFLIQAFKMAKDTAVYHGFGVTSWVIMSSFPWYSVDSSSWGSGFRFGQVPIFDASHGGFVDARLGNFADWRKVENIVREMGFDPADFWDRKRNDRAKICAISALSYIRAERYLQKKFGKIYIPGSSAPEVLRAHLADANPQRFIDAQNGSASAGLRLHLSDTSNGINYGDAAEGLRVHLADARGHTAADLSAAEHGLKLHLAEHSLDRGGVGDTSRAMEGLK